MGCCVLTPGLWSPHVVLGGLSLTAAFYVLHRRRHCNVFLIFIV